MGNTMKREADLLEAMQYATLGEQKMLTAELDALRATASSNHTAERESDLADAIVRDHLTPVLVHTMHGASTDWLGEIVPDYTTANLGEITNTMRTEATLWFNSVSEGVKANRDELAIQADGAAQRLASQYGELAQQARSGFMSHVAHLYRTAEGTDLGTIPSAAGDSSNPDLAPWGDVEALPPAGPVDYTAPPGLDAGTPQPDPASGSTAANPQDYPEDTPHDELDDPWNGPVEASSRYAYEGPVAFRGANRLLATEEGQTPPTPGEVDPEQDGEAASSLPVSVDWNRQAETFETFAPEGGPTAVPSTRAPNVTGAQHTATKWYVHHHKDPVGTASVHKHDSDPQMSDKGMEGVGFCTGPFPTRAKANTFANYFNSTPGKKNFASRIADARQYTAAHWEDTPEGSAGVCGDTSPHGFHIFAPGRFCNGNQEQFLVGDPVALDENTRPIKDQYGNYVLEADQSKESQRRTAVATGPNPQGSFVYDPAVVHDKGYAEGMYYALRWEPGKPVPAAMSSAASIGDKYNVEYVAGYQAGVNDGIGKLSTEFQTAWASAHRQQVLSSLSVTATDYDEEARYTDAPEGSTAKCKYCHENILLDQKEGGGPAKDWGSGDFDQWQKKGYGLDYGCDTHPASNEDGAYGHVPDFESLNKDTKYTKDIGAPYPKHSGSRKESYKIVRRYFNERSPRTIKRGLTLEDAQAHCQREDTHGGSTDDGSAWFDGYTREDHDAALHTTADINPTNETRTLTLPYSEVCMSMGVAGKTMKGQLTNNGYGVQLFNDDGSMFSFPITQGEAGWDLVNGEDTRYARRVTAESCKHCGESIHSVPGGRGSVWVNPDGYHSCRGIRDASGKAPQTHEPGNPPWHEAALPQLQLADMDQTPSNPGMWDQGGGAADVANVPTPGQGVADYPQPRGGAAPAPAVGTGAEVIDPVIDEVQAQAFRQTIQANLRLEAENEDRSVLRDAKQCPACGLMSAFAHGDGEIKCQGCGAVRKSSSRHTANQYVQKRGDHWVVLQKGTGKVLSTHDSEEKAEGSFRAIEMWKHHGGSRVTAADPAADGSVSHGESFDNPTQNYADGWHDGYMGNICGSANGKYLEGWYAGHDWKQTTGSKGS